MDGRGPRSKAKRVNPLGYLWSPDPRDLLRALSSLNENRVSLPDASVMNRVTELVKHPECRVARLAAFLVGLRWTYRGAWETLAEHVSPDVDQELAQNCLFGLVRISEVDGSTERVEFVGSLALSILADPAADEDLKETAADIIRRQFGTQEPEPGTPPHQEPEPGMSPRLKP